MADQPQDRQLALGHKELPELAKGRHLRVIDPATGEIVEGKCSRCEQLERTYAELQRKYNGALSQIGNLRADRAAQAQVHALWGQAIAVFQEWKLAADHPRSAWTSERFWLVLPYLEQDGFGMCLWAVWGIAYMPNTKEFPSGYVERFDSWELCFRNRGTFERYVNRGYSNPEARSRWLDVFPITRRSK